MDFIASGTELIGDYFSFADHIVDGIKIALGDMAAALSGEFPSS